jgi:hypothetical protein
LRTALIVMHHVRKSIGRDEIGRAFRGSSALHAVGDSYLLLARPSANLAARLAGRGWCSTGRKPWNFEHRG